MLFHLPLLLRRVLIGWACVVWVVGSSGTQLHAVLYTHVICAEHGVVEHAADAAVATTSAHDEGPSVRSADESAHGEACPFDCVPSSAALIPISAPALAYVITFAETSLVPLAGAPCGPPLAYAPKTSPPFVA
jgi:hypothetical protein